MSQFYRLDENRQPVPVDDLITWARWYGTADRKVCQTDTDVYSVSTVFLGLDHGWGRNRPPVLFETLVFDRGMVAAALDGEMYRYVSWDDALAGHEALVKRLRSKEAAAKATIRDRQPPP